MNDFLPGSPLAVLVTDLVAEFGDGWSVDIQASYLHGVFVDGPDVRLFVRNPDYGASADLAKLEITGSVPTSVPTHRRHSAGRGLDWGKIGVSATRPVEQICKDIRTRLLDTARAAYAAVLAGETRDAADRAARHAMRDQLIALLPDPRVAKEDDDAARTDITAYGPGESELHTEWRLNRDGTQLNLKLSGLTPSQARQIAVLLFTYRKGK